jgi:hypothetical protein
MNGIIILFQQFHAVAMPLEQLNLIAHHCVFPAAELISIVGNQDSHGVTLTPPS